KLAVVSWTAPSDGGSPITRYTVTSKTGRTAGPQATVDGNPPATSVTVRGLDSRRIYKFAVTATNHVGDGPLSTYSTRVSPDRCLRFDEKRPMRGLLAAVFLAGAVVAEVVRGSERWTQPPSDRTYWFTVVLLVAALIFAVLWAHASISARGRTEPAKS